MARTGRPTKYSAAYCNEVIQHMAEGASLTSFAAEIGVARSTLNEWMGEHPEFSEACARAKAKSAAWWEREARKIAQQGGGTGSSPMVMFGLKNMAADDWQDVSRSELSGPGGAPIQTDNKVSIDASGLSDDQLAALASIPVHEG